MTIENKITADALLDLLVGLKPDQAAQLNKAADDLRTAWEGGSVDDMVEHHMTSHKAVRRMVRQMHYSQVEELMRAIEGAGDDLASYAKGGVRT